LRQHRRLVRAGELADAWNAYREDARPWYRESLNGKPLMPWDKQPDDTDALLYFFNQDRGHGDQVFGAWFRKVKDGTVVLHAAQPSANPFSAPLEEKSLPPTSLAAAGEQRHWRDDFLLYLDEPRLIVRAEFHAALTERLRRLNVKFDKYLEHHRRLPAARDTEIRNSLIAAAGSDITAVQYDEQLRNRPEWRRQRRRHSA
jgi:hypothetical protein